MLAPFLAPSARLILKPASIYDAAWSRAFGRRLAKTTFGGVHAAGATFGDASRLDFQVFLFWPAMKREMFAVRVRMFSGCIPKRSKFQDMALLRSRLLAGRDRSCYVSKCIQRGLRPRQPALTGNGGTTMWPKWATIGRSALPDACATWRVFYAFTTRFSDWSGRSAHGGIRQGCTVICASERAAPARPAVANCPRPCSGMTTTNRA